MALDRRTYRIVDGEQIEGTWRPIFIHNGPTYFLTDLLTYADGAIYCWEWVDLDGLRRKLDSGWVATTIEFGAQASAHELASWRFGEPQMWVSAEDLLGEVADEIDQLNNRPDSAQRCLHALDQFLQTRTEEDRRALRAAYLAIPTHRRLYTLGDMDAQDQPLRVLSLPVGARIYEDEVDAQDLGDDDEIITKEMHQHALEYFERSRTSTEQSRANRAAEGPDQPHDPAVKLAMIPGKWPEDPGVLCLRNEYPSTVEIDGETWASAEHAYWALATIDEATRASIRETPTAPLSVRRAIEGAPLRADWPDLRVTAMHSVLRAKFTQHPELADVLVATGDARIEYSIHSAFWSGGQHGRNWLGRLLELVRSEIVAQRAGFLSRE